LPLREMRDNVFRVCSLTSIPLAPDACRIRFVAGDF
jgi:hypothetical protein